MLARHNINDYSLLLAVVKNDLREKQAREKVYYKVNPVDPSIGYFIGIIDTLTKFEIKKQFEYIFKSITQGEGASCKPPKQYSYRFQRFMRRLFYDCDQELDLK